MTHACIDPTSVGSVRWEPPLVDEDNDNDNDNDTLREVPHLSNVGLA